VRIELMPVATKQKAEMIVSKRTLFMDQKKKD
jgi:hypothetical protein